MYSKRSIDKLTIMAYYLSYITFLLLPFLHFFSFPAIQITSLSYHVLFSSIYIFNCKTSTWNTNQKDNTYTHNTRTLSHKLFKVRLLPFSLSSFPSFSLSISSHSSFLASFFSFFLSCFLHSLSLFLFLVFAVPFNREPISAKEVPDSIPGGPQGI